MDTVRAIAFLIVGLIAGLVGYQIGVSQNIAAQIPAGAAAAAPAYYWYGPHMFGWGFPFLGFLFPLLFFFLFVSLIAAAVRGGRRWSGHGSWADARRMHFEEMHREAHGEKPAAGGSAPTA